MVPHVNRNGTSFKGAFAYYFHDKKPDVLSPFPTSSNRVEWAEYRNLFAEDPKVACAIMTATANLANSLKRKAGIKATGRQSKACVYSYSLSWHPVDAAWLNREKMIKAADETLEWLELSKYQAIIVCHNDESHLHVHVIVNRVDQDNGKLSKNWNDRTILWDWAVQYDRKISEPNRKELLPIEPTSSSVLAPII